MGLGRKESEPQWFWHTTDHHSGTVLVHVFGRRKDAVFLLNMESTAHKDIPFLSTSPVRSPALSAALRSGSTRASGVSPSGSPRSRPSQETGQPASPQPVWPYAPGSRVPQTPERRARAVPHPERAIAPAPAWCRLSRVLPHRARVSVPAPVSSRSG